MAEEKRKETDEELIERFDSFVRATILEEGNKLRAEKGYPLLTEEDMADAAHSAECDYVGIESANKVPDKLAKAGFHTEKAEHVDAPVILELPMAVECRLVSYDKETCRLVGEIVNVSADEKILDENGKIDPAKLEPIVFDPVNNAYLKLGEKVGNAFKDGMKLK